MSSEIKVDTISENTSGNGVAIDSLAIKDGKITNLMNATLSAADLGTGIHIKTADSGGGVNTSADNLIIEDSGDSGITILAGTGNHSRINFGDSGDNDIGMLTYDHGANQMNFKTNASFAMIIDSSGAISTGGETSPDVDTGGLCLNQGANDTNILTLKSSDVAHGMTTLAETDTYATIEKTSGGEGGLFIESFCEGITNLMLFGTSASETTTKASSGTGPVEIRGKSKSGTTASSMGADTNVLCIRNHSLTRFIFDADGDFHAESGSTTFDAYEDAHLVRAYDLSHGKGVIDSKFDKFVSYNHEKLADLQLVGREEDGTPNHFINVTGMQRLHNGAIWQQYEKHQKLANAMYELAKAAVGKEKANEILEQNDIKLLN